MSMRFLPCVPAALVALAGLAPQTLASGNENARPAGIAWRADGEQLSLVTPYVIAASSNVALTLTNLQGDAAQEGMCIVRLTRTPTQDDRAFLAANGLRLLGLLTSESFYARLLINLDSNTLARSGLIAGAEPMQARWKIEPRLLTMRTGDTTPLWTSDEEALKNNPGKLLKDASQMVVPLSILLHDDVDAAATVNKLAKFAEGGAVTPMTTLPMLTLHTRLANLEAIAAIADVQWMEPSLPALTTTNAQNRALTGADVAQSSPYNLNGAGIGVFVFDGGLVLPSHVALSGRVQTTETGTDNIIDHATHCAGTVAGDGDPDAARTHRGMAPAANIYTAGVSINGATGWLYTNPTDIEADYIAAFNAGAVMASNSIGTNVEPNGFDCTWHGNYGAVSVLVDRLVVGGAANFNQGNPSRIVWAAGNERQGSRCAPNTPGYRKLAPPAPSKNLLLIGAVNADAGANGDTMTDFSSFGPTDDGRLKPDVVGPGCQVGGDTGVTSSTSSSTTSYASFCGTSMACPTVAGLSALLMQDLRTQFPGIPDPRNSTLRAIFASTAVDRGLPGPDYQFGYGSVRIMPAIELARAANFRESTIVQGQILSFEVLVPEGTPQLRVTLAWDDVPGNPAIIPQLVNNIDLEVIDPAGVRRGVWRLDAANPGNAATRETGATAAGDAVNNIEQVQVDAPISGVYTVRVIGTSIPTGPGPGGTGEQSFSIASTSQLRSLGGVPLIYIASRQLVPALQAPGQLAEVRAAVSAFSDEVVAGSVMVKYRNTPTGDVQSVAMTSTDGRNFSAMLPGFACGSQPRYWFEARGAGSGVVTLPATATTGNVFATSVGAYELVRTDPLETLTGWTVSGSVWTGRWTNQNPSQTTSPDGVLIYQPEDDASATGTRCWVTDGRTGTTPQQLDVDGGSTTITSGPIDLTGVDAPRVGYSRWFYSYTSGSPLRIEASLDGATWRDVEQVAGSDVANARGGWKQTDFAVNQLFGVVNPPSVRLRVTATDGNPLDGIVEAAFDDIRVLGVACRPPACDSIDFNNDGLFPSDEDLVTFLAVLAGGTCTTCNDIDFNNDGLFPSDEDLVAYLRALAGAGC